MVRDNQSRRRFLRGSIAIGALVGAASLTAACGGGPTSGGTAANQPAATSVSQKAAAPTTAPAAASNAAPSGPITLVVASFYPINQVSGWGGLIKTWNKDHPQIKVEPQITPGNQYVAKIVSQFASGTAPDIVGAENSVIFFQFVSSKVLEDLDDYLAATKGFTKDDFFPKLMNRYTVKGKVYGIPYDNQPVASLFYSNKMFTQQGATAPTAAWTWNDLLTTATSLTQRSGNRTTRYGINAGWTSILYAFGGSLVDDVANPTKCTLDSQQSIAAIQFYVDLIYKHKVMPSPQDLQATGGSEIDLYSTGKLAMDLNGFWIAVENPDRFKAIDTKMQIGPKGPDGTQAYSTGGTAYCVVAASKQKESAWQFVTYYMGEPGHKAEYEAAKAPGASYPPAHIPSFDWYAKQPNYIGNNVGEVIEQADKSVIFAPASLSWPEVNTKVITPAMDLISRQKQPVNSLTQVASQATDMLQKLQKQS